MKFSQHFQMQFDYSRWNGMTVCTQLIQSCMRQLLNFITKNDNEMVSID